MKTAYINGTEIADSTALHTALSVQLGFPDWYGRNLDALYDLLTEPGEPRRVVVRDEAALRGRLGGYFDRFLLVLSDAAEENAAFSFLLEI